MTSALTMLAGGDEHEAAVAEINALAADVRRRLAIAHPLFAAVPPAVPGSGSAVRLPGPGDRPTGDA